MESPNLQGMPAPQPKKSNTGLIIAVVVAVLLCCCCLIAAGAAYYVKTKASSAINEQLTAMPNFLTSVPSVPEMMTAVPDMMTSVPEMMTSMPSGTSSPEATPGSSEATPGSSDLGIPAGTIPDGGLGNELQRTQAWAISLSTVIMNGCMSPVAKDTKIEVTQQPDASGAWKEHWTIACDGAAAVPVDVTYKPTNSGLTDIRVALSK